MGMRTSAFLEFNHVHTCLKAKKHSIFNKFMNFFFLSGNTRSKIYGRSRAICPCFNWAITSGHCGLAVNVNFRACILGKKQLMMANSRFALFNTLSSNPLYKSARKVSWLSRMNLSQPPMVLEHEKHLLLPGFYLFRLPMRPPLFQNWIFVHVF